MDSLYHVRLWNYSHAMNNGSYFDLVLHKRNTYDQGGLLDLEENTQFSCC